MNTVLVPVERDLVLNRHAIPMLNLIHEIEVEKSAEEFWFYKWTAPTSLDFVGMSFLHHFKDSLSLKLVVHSDGKKGEVELPIKSFLDENKRLFPWELLDIPNYPSGALPLYLKGVNDSDLSLIQEVAVLYQVESPFSTFYFVSYPDGRKNWILLDLENHTYMEVGEVTQYMSSSLVNEWKEVLQNNLSSTRFQLSFVYDQEMMRVAQKFYFSRKHFDYFEVCSAVFGKNILSSPLSRMSVDGALRGGLLDASKVSWEDFF